MENEVSYIVFAGNRTLVTGDLKNILSQTKDYLDNNAELPILIFEEQTGRQIDFNFQGTPEELLARELPTKIAGPGRSISTFPVSVARARQSSSILISRQFHLRAVRSQERKLRLPQALC